MSGAGYRRKRGGKGGWGGKRGQEVALERGEAEGGARDERERLREREGAGERVRMGEGGRERERRLPWR